MDYKRALPLKHKRTCGVQLGFISEIKTFHQILSLHKNLGLRGSTWMRLLFSSCKDIWYYMCNNTYKAIHRLAECCLHLLGVAGHLECVIHPYFGVKVLGCKLLQVNIPYQILGNKILLWTLHFGWAVSFLLHRCSCINCKVFLTV